MTYIDPDTGLDVSGLIQKHVFDDADLAVFEHYQDEEAREVWLDDLRSEAKDEDDADALASAVAAYRQSLTRTEAGDAGNWPATAFQLACSLHALGEVRHNGLAEPASRFQLQPP